MGSTNDSIGDLRPLYSADERPLPNPTPAAQTIFSQLPSSVVAPPSTPLVASPPRFLIIGAGSRGNAYARSVTRTTRGLIAAVAEPEAFQREELGKKYIWGRQGRDAPGPGEEFTSWQEWLAYEVNRREKESLGVEVEKGVDGVFVCTLDETHKEIVVGIAEKDVRVHVLCEKPLATSWKDCLAIWRAMRGCGKVFGIGHVLRYSPHNMILRKLLLEEKVIGDILSIEHTEPIGWWHYSHSYVRGNWRRKTPAGVGSILTKSCHDIDFIMWLLCSPPPSEHPTATPTAPPHLPKTISSTGHLSYFRRSRKPAAAGEATNCLSCPAEPTCIYSSKKIYIDRHIYRERDIGWPLKIVAPEIEDTFNHHGWDGAEKLVISKLAENYPPGSPDAKIKGRSWYGRCVYESDNDVCDDQVVTMTWDDESVPPGATEKTPILPQRAAKMAIFHMTAQTQRQCERYGHVSGSQGHLSYDGTTITAHSFVADETQTWTPPRPNAKEQGHGGGDDGLARQFVSAVEAVEAGAMRAEEANKSFLGVTLEECVRSHAVVFAAEESRMGGGKVIDWGKWFAKNWRD